jgi:formylglycine-generating enzyme required for sulfatase activity
MKNLLSKNNLALRAVTFSVLFSIAFSMLPLAANAQTTEPPPSRQLVMKEKTLGELPRFALVIGNAKYEHISQLKNANADAVDMAAALRSLGFDVLEGVDQNKKQMEKLIQEFGDKLYRNKGIGVFFYAGHGVQSNNNNFLIPINADIPNENDIEYEAVNLGRLLKRFDTAKNELNIIILDACRNNPFAKEWSSYRDVNADEGLAKLSAPKGTVLFYSTEPGKVASDGAGRNGLFTEVLLENIKKPNLEFDALSKAVTRGVAAKSKQTQIPYKEGTSFSDFYFAGETATNPVLPSPVGKTNEAEPEIVAKDAAAREREAWELVVNSTDVGDFRSFLTEFPNGNYAGKAKIRMEQMFWNSIKTTRDKLLVRAFLKEFPDGANASTARIKLRQLEAKENARTTTAEITNTETAKVETVETESEESAPPAKKMIVPKAETSKATASARTGKTKPKTASAASKLAIRSNPAGMEFVYLPAGSFMMGSSEANVSESFAQGRKDYGEVERAWFDNEKPQHKVTFADGFWIGKTEVTQAQWTAIMGENPSNNKDCSDCPVERISWEDAKKFVEKLNAQNDDYEYRLPTEAEWEYAARGGKTGILAGKPDETAWYNVNSENKTHPVGTLQPNAFGLYDMHGNVAEWCEDVYVENYNGAPSDGTANTTGETDLRVLRGGTYNDFPTYLRLARRDKLRIKIRAIVNGLRVVAVEKQP